MVVETTSTETQRLTQAIAVDMIELRNAECHFLRSPQKISPRGRLSCALWALLLLLPAPVYAEYWVSVGSFKSRVRAEIGLQAAQQASKEPYAVVAKETSAGLTYRVAAGPYADFDLAKNRASRLREQQYPTAWVWFMPAGDSTGLGGSLSGAARSPANQMGANATNSSASSDPDVDDRVVTWSVLDREESSIADEQVRRADASSVADDAQVQTEAPAGYTLNKLKQN